MQLLTHATAFDPITDTAECAYGMHSLHTPRTAIVIMEDTARVCGGQATTDHIEYRRLQSSFEGMHAK